MLLNEYAPESEVPYEAQDQAQVLEVSAIIEQSANILKVDCSKELILFETEEDDDILFYSYCTDHEFDVVHVYIYKYNQDVRVVFHVNEEDEVQYFSCLDAFARKDA